MKKVISVILSITMLAVCFASCKANNETAEEVTTTELDAAERDLREALAIYKTPSAMFDLDLDSYDLSTDEIDFTYSDEGRFLNCTYKIGNRDVFVAYSYDDDASTVSVLVFVGTVLVAEESFVYTSGYDRYLGFTEYGGYYFRGLSFTE